MSNETKEAIEATVFQHDMENILDEVIDMLPEDEKHLFLTHFVESFNLRFGTSYRIVKPKKLNFPIDRIQFYLNELKKLNQ